MRHSSNRRRLGRWLSLAFGLTVGVVGWEYLLNASTHPDVSWNVRGVLAHAALDLVLLLPLLAAVLAGGRVLARRLGMGRDDLPGLLGTVGVVSLLFLIVSVPVDTGRDLAHEWVGTTYGISMAEVTTTVVRTDLTVREATQLCSFGSVRNPSLARENAMPTALVWRLRAQSAVRDALVQLAAFLPLLILGLIALFGRRLRGTLDFGPIAAVATWLRPARLGTIALGLFVMFCVGYGIDQSSPGVGVAHAQVGGGTFNPCTDGGPVRTYNVSAIDITMTLNRWGDHVNNAYMYALDANIPAIEQFEAELAQGRLDMLDDPNAPGVARVAAGLRKDPIQPLVIRANLGECLRINFTNRIDEDDPSSLHILGLAHTAGNAGSAVGNNPSSFAGFGDSVTYEIPMPDDAEAERAYYFHDHGAGRRRQNMGLFGAIVAEPKGATYLDVETGLPLTNETGSNWEAIILDPNVDGRPDGKSFREFVIFYHEIGDEGFTDIRDYEGELMPLIDDVAGVYRPAARALNYRSEPFRRRMELDKQINGDAFKNGKALGYASYPFGDPGTPIPRSYVGEGVKTRLMHGGSEVFHVHHLHGGGDRWRRNPNADPNNDFWKGLTKVPDPNLTSIHLDSQSIGPGTSYNLEHECGAGGCQQGVGDFLFHCHIGHHYISGMWSFWRVYGTVQTPETNMNGFPLAVIPELHQPDNPFPEAASNTPPAMGVSAGALLGLRVDDGKTLVATVDNPATETALTDWIADQLPPAGVPFDKNDATVWDWTSTGSGASYQVWGEPEETMSFAGWESPNPGVRPEVLFNPKNGRYTYPLFRPHVAARPPFTARHTGAPWLGEDMKEGRLDGLCAKDGLAGVDLGGVAQKRFYPVSAIMLPLQVTADRVDPDGQIFVLNEEEAAIRRGDKPAEPLAIRSNVGDCVEILFTNKIPDGPLNKNFSKVNIHSHFVQFDTQASDGVITGMSYEQSVRPIESEGRTLTSPAGPGSTVLQVDHTDRLREGIWIGIGLGEGVCGFTDQGQPMRCTEIRKITALGPTSITLDQPLQNSHAIGEAVGVEFVRYHWYSDVDFGTVFYHTHVEFKDWDHGLFGTHIVEPKGSTYHDPTTGEEVRSGTLVDIRVDPTAGGNPVAPGVDGSFREFMLFLQNNNPVEGQFERGGGTINLRAEPWRLRTGDPDNVTDPRSDPAWRFSSVTHGDPVTPTVRAYVGDPVVVRGMGLVERVGGVRFTGHRFHMERTTDTSDTRDTTFIGISERFDVSLEGGAGGTGGQAGDYLYYSTLGKDFESGAWGILRVHDTAQGSLQPLPGMTPGGGSGFPQLGFTGAAPPVLPGSNNICPASAPVREYSLVIDDSTIVYNDLAAADIAAVVYRDRDRPSQEARTPIVMRANAGDCLAVNLRNARSRRSSINIGEMVFDPQRAYGGAVGYNYDSTIEPGRGKRYHFYADKELGTVIALNLADVKSAQRGAFAAVIIEPSGSTYHRPGRPGEALPQGGLGIQADIVIDGVTMREYVALFSDEDRKIGQNDMPYPDRVQRFAGLSYTQEPLALRGQRISPADVFRSSQWGDPRHVVTVPAGTPLVYRVAQPWGNQMHVPTLEGHRWLQEPGMVGSEQVYNDVLAPGMSLNLYFVGGAGGDIQAPGDFLFLDRRQPFLEYGLWNILRVTDDGTSGADDRVRIGYVETPAANTLSIFGVNGLRPAGDFAEAVTVYDGSATATGCSGTALGTAEVDPGSGIWQFAGPVVSVPAEVCVASPGGGFDSRPVGP